MKNTQWLLMLLTMCWVATAQPKLVSPQDGSNNQPVTLELEWNEVAPYDFYYIIQYSTSYDFLPNTYIDTTAGDEYTAKMLFHNTTYYWRVKEEGDTTWSGVWSFMTVIAAPSAPTLLSPPNGITYAPTSLNLSWNSLSVATTYNVQVSTLSSFTTTVTSQTGVAGPSASVSGLANSTPYYWEVSATNAGGTSAWSGAWSFTTEIATPIAPTLISPPNNPIYNLPTLLTLSWSTVTGAATYNVLVSTSANFSTTVSSKMGLTGLSTSENLSVSTTYYWEVNATNILGTSAWSNAWSFTTGSETLISQSNRAISPTICNVQNGIIHYSVPKQTTVNISLYDMRGKQVFNSSAIASAGVHRLSLGDILPAGSYIVRFKANRFEKSIVAAFM
jgi:hypothetical protein